MNPDDDYKQIFFSNQSFFNEDRHSSIRIDLTHRSYLLIFIFLICTSQSITAVPVSPSKSPFETYPFDLLCFSSSELLSCTIIAHQSPSIDPSYSELFQWNDRASGQRQSETIQTRTISTFNDRSINFPI